MTVCGFISTLILAYISIAIVQAWCLICVGIYLTVICQVVTLGILWKRSHLHFWACKKLFWFPPALIFIVVGAYQWLFAPAREAVKLTEASNFDQSSELFLPVAEKLDISLSPYRGFGEDYRKGGDDAQVVIVKFSDFQCPACEHMSRVLAELHREYGDRVLIVYKNFPLDSACNTDMRGSMHQFACKIAILARCAGRLGKFWQYHDIAFAEQLARQQLVFLSGGHSK